MTTHPGGRHPACLYLYENPGTKKGEKGGGKKKEGEKGKKKKGRKEKKKL
jgi:hypothetical protein